MATPWCFLEADSVTKRFEKEPGVIFLFIEVLTVMHTPVNKADIYQVLQGVANPTAGPTHSVAGLAHHLVKLGRTVDVLAFGEAPVEWPCNAKLHLFNGCWEQIGLAGYEAISYVRQHSVRPSIWHGHGAWRASNLFPLVIRSGSPVKIVWSPRGMFTEWSWQHRSLRKMPYWHLLQRPALKSVDCFHATAASEYEDVRRLGFKMPVAVIPNGVNIPVLKDNGTRVNRILFLSRIHPKKGLDLLIPVWSELAGQFPEWELVIAGPLNSTYAGEVVREVETRKIPRIRFVGEVVGEAKRDLLFSSKLFVLPTYSENFGIAVAEALAHQVPVITTTETPWHKLNEYNCGWCIAPTADNLKESMKRALSCSSAELASMGSHGRLWMERDFGWHGVASRMSDVYRWLLEGGVPPDCVITD